MENIILWGEFPPETITGISISNNTIYKILKKENTSLCLVKEYSWNKKGYSKILHNIGNYFRVAGKVKRGKSNILYVNIPLSSFGLLKILPIFPLVKLLSRNIKFIGHLHRGDLNCFINENSIGKIILRLFLNCIDVVILLSDKYIMDLVHIRPNIAVNVLPNTSQYETKIRPNRPQYSKKYICISNYIQSKGLLELVECFNKPELHSSTITIFGKNYDNKFKNKLSSLATPNIILDNLLEREHFKDELLKYDCLILPSWNEGQPIVLLEAMSLGIPIIATRVGTIPEMLGENYKYMALPRNSESLLETIFQFDQYDDKDAVSMLLYDRYHSIFSNSIYVNKVKSIFLPEENKRLFRSR